MMISPGVLHAIFRDTSTKTLSLVCAFSFLWGFGTISFGEIVKLVGISLGTSLFLSTILIVGTLLPIFVFGAALDVQLLLILLGAVFALIGFALSSLAGYKRDTNSPSYHEELPAATNIDTSTDNDHPYEEIHIEMKEIVEFSSSSPKQTSSELSMNYKILVAVVGGLFAVQLQFAFIFGNAMIENAKSSDFNVSGEYAPLCIWYFAFGLGSVVGVLYCILLIYKNQSWDQFRACSFLEGVINFGKVLSMAIVWVSHIHLYGLSQYYFGEKVGPALSWPILMSSTVLMGQFWAVLFEEWKYAPLKAKQLNWLSMGSLLVSVGLLAVAGLLL